MNPVTEPLRFCLQLVNEGTPRGACDTFLAVTFATVLGAGVDSLGCSSEPKLKKSRDIDAPGFAFSTASCAFIAAGLGTFFAGFFFPNELFFVEMLGDLGAKKYLDPDVDCTIAPSAALPAIGDVVTDSPFLYPLDPVGLILHT